MTERASRIGGDLVTLHSRGHVRQRKRREGLRHRQRVSEPVDLNDVGDVPAVIAEPDDTAGENQAQKHETASGDLPVAFSENEVSVSFVLVLCESGGVRIRAHFAPWESLWTRGVANSLLRGVSQRL